MRLLSLLFLLGLSVAVLSQSTSSASKITIKQSLFDDILQQELPKLLPSRIAIPDISTSFRTLFTFYFNATNASIDNISCKFNNSLVSFLSDKNAIEAKIGNY
jgi:hypothetical protein